MRRWTIFDFILLIMAATVAFTLCGYILGMFILKQETNEQNIQLRLKLADLLMMIAGGVMTILGRGMGSKSQDKDVP